jgi:hypothetical protein
MARCGELALSCYGSPRALSDRRYLKQRRAERTHEQRTEKRSLLT